MTRAQARLYIVAARKNSFLAAWICVLDRHRMYHRTEIAPSDWEEAFEQFFHLGLVAEEQFNATDFKRQFRRRTPPLRDLEAALSALAALRQDTAKETPMTNKFDVFEKSDELVSTRRSDAAIAKHDGFLPISPRAPVSGEVLAPTETPPPAALAPIHRVVEIGAGQPARLPCTSIDEGELPVDPRTYIEEFSLRILCCSRELELVCDDARDVTGELDGEEGEVMVEFIFHTRCSHCRGEGHHSFVRPIPNDCLPR